MHTPMEFYIKTPVDLFRAGTPTRSKFDYIRTMPPRTEDQRYDMKIDPVTKIIDNKSGGMSLFNSPNMAFSPNWWVIPRATALPPGFTVSKDLTDGVFKGHYTIRSLRPIKLDLWKKILLEWAEENAVHINEFRNKGVI